MNSPQIMILNTSLEARATLDGWLMAAWLIHSEPNTSVTLVLPKTVDSKQLVCLGSTSQLLIKHLGIELEALDGRFVYGLSKHHAGNEVAHGFSEQLIRIAGVGIDQFIGLSEPNTYTSLAKELASRNIQKAPEHDLRSIWSSISPVYLVPLDNLINALVSCVLKSSNVTAVDASEHLDSIIDRLVGVKSDSIEMVSRKRDYVVDVSLLAESRLPAEINGAVDALVVESTETISCGESTGERPDAMYFETVDDEHIRLDYRTTNLMQSATLGVTRVAATTETWNAQGVVRFGRATCVVDTFNYLNTDALLDEVTLWRSFTCHRSCEDAVTKLYTREAQRLRNYYNDFILLHFVELVQRPFLTDLVDFYQSTGALPLMENNPITIDRWLILINDLYGAVHNNSAVAKRINQDVVSQSIARINHQISVAIAATDRR